MDRRKLVLGLGVLGVQACATRQDFGGVVDDGTGLSFGSAVERNLILDSSQFKNRTVKITTRNTSGDPFYQLDDFALQIAEALRRKGYSPTQADSHGLRFDVNVLYSGQVQRNMAAQYAFLGGAAGAVAGYRADTRGGTAGGALLGATIGSIVGSNVTSNTYIVLAELTVGIAMPNEPASGNTTIVFGSSPPLQRESSSNFTPFREMLRTRVAVFAGGANLQSRTAAPEVRRRLVNIVENSL